MSTWWEHFGEKRKLLVLLVDDKDKILAIAPFMMSKYRLPGFGCIKKIELIATPTSDYNSLIIIDKGRECLKLILRYLMDNYADWDYIEMKEIPENSSVVNMLDQSSLPSSGLKYQNRVCNVCPYIPLQDSIDPVLKRLTKNKRQNLKRYMLKLEDRYKVRFKRYEETDCSISDAMKAFIRLHQKRWKPEEKLGIFSSEKVREFHMDIAECFAEKGWLGLYFLTANDEPISAQYTFEYGHKMYYYQSGFDPEYSSYSVGNLTMRLILEECIKKGFKEYDMLRSAPAYKMEWTDNTRRNYEIRFCSGKLLSRIYSWITWSKFLGEMAKKSYLTLKQNRETNV